MWTFKNSKELLEHLKSPTFNHTQSKIEKVLRGIQGEKSTSIKSFVFFHALYNHTSPEIQKRLTSIIRNCFQKR